MPNQRDKDDRDTNNSKLDEYGQKPGPQGEGLAEDVFSGGESADRIAFKELLADVESRDDREYPEDPVKELDIGDFDLGSLDDLNLDDALGATGKSAGDEADERTKSGSFDLDLDADVPTGDYSTLLSELEMDAEDAVKKPVPERDAGASVGDAIGEWPGEADESGPVDEIPAVIDIGAEASSERKSPGEAFDVFDLDDPDVFGEAEHPEAASGHGGAGESEPVVDDVSGMLTGRIDLNPGLFGEPDDMTMESAGTGDGESRPDAQNDSGFGLDTVEMDPADDFTLPGFEETVEADALATDDEAAMNVAGDEKGFVIGGAGDDENADFLGLDDDSDTKKDDDLLGMVHETMQPFHADLSLEDFDMEAGDQVAMVTRAEMFLVQGKRAEAVNIYAGLAEQRGVTPWVKRRLQELEITAGSGGAKPAG